MSVPGIRPLNPPYPRKVADALAAMMQANVAPLRLFRTFARNLPMPQAMQPWRRYELSADLSLSLRDREILIDPTCIRCRCEHESSVHTKLLRRQGAADASPGVVAGVRLANRPVLDRRAGSGCSSPPQTHCTTRPPSARICGERSLQSSMRSSGSTCCCPAGITLSASRPAPPASSSKTTAPESTR